MTTEGQDKLLGDTEPLCSLLMAMVTQPYTHGEGHRIQLQKEAMKVPFNKKTVRASGSQRASS